MFVVVVGGGILIEDTIWTSSKGKRCQASLPTQKPLTLRVKVVFLPFFVKIVNENEFSCKILSRYFAFKRILSLKLKRN